ncbi:SET domain-containing protein [Caenorhabditis elegans]|uniref:SET domain-containing protein n=1 Tax=Caenorhabditis elegans TaxID=6239 RepID=Q19117_CAEEL|nr:SET domain-containing protein [Caenorhabditis elegans]CAA91938.3 SET domain-containing protein [Caenorhabditis elegans]
MMCPDHICEICFTEGFESSATLGNLLHEQSTIRAFHSSCMPAGYTEKNAGVVSLNPRIQEFLGTHFPACGTCGTSTPPMIKCSGCVHSFHRACFPMKLTEESKSHCESCVFDIRMRIGDEVLTEKDEIFCSGVIEDWNQNHFAKQDENFGKEGFASILFDGVGSRQILPINSLFRPYSRVTNIIFHSIKSMYNGHPQELENLKSMLQKIESQRPPVSRPIPKFQSISIFHSTIKELLCHDDDFLPNVKTCEDLLLKFEKNKGYGVFATKILENGCVIGQYCGEYISEKEKARRDALAKVCNDKECKFYSFQVKLELLNELQAQKVYVDGSSVKNITAILNTSCEPNCTAIVEEISIQNIRIEYIVIKTKRTIKVGEELTINYKWNSSFKCFCGSEKCKSPWKPSDWQ